MTNTVANRTVMVVDDSNEVRELLRAQLSMLGYRVVEATNGQEAIEAVCQDSPQLIFMDLSMPVLDGIEATRLIRENLRNSGVVIVAFTALPSAHIRQKALAAGCNDVVHKPLDVDKLSKLLERHLREC